MGAEDEQFYLGTNVQTEMSIRQALEVKSSRNPETALRSSKDWGGEGSAKGLEIKPGAPASRGP